jgi:sedoheptulokinase
MTSSSDAPSLIFATYHGLANGLRDLVPEAVLKKTEGLIGSGNALQRDALLRSCVADAFGSPLHLSPNREEAALGAALHAGVAAGVFIGYEEAQRGVVGAS